MRDRKGAEGVVLPVPVAEHLHVPAVLCMNCSSIYSAFEFVWHFRDQAGLTMPWSLNSCTRSFSV
jgi:hypothetical protein